MCPVEKVTLERLRVKKYNLYKPSKFGYKIVYINYNKFYTVLFFQESNVLTLRQSTHIKQRTEFVQECEKSTF